MNDENKSREDVAKSFFLLLLLASPVLGVFAVWGRVEQGFGAWACLATVLIVVRSGWALKRHVRFWIAIAIVFLLQIPIMLYVPWTARGFNGRAVMPLAFVDGALGLGIVKLAEMAIKSDDKSGKKE